jgi:hypothetical protein
VSRFDVSAVAGASGAETGVAGALAIGVVVSDTSAKIKAGADIDLTPGGSVSVTAVNVIESSVKGSGKQAGTGNVGVGASFALNVAETDTDAVIGASADLAGAGNVSLKATSGNTMETTGVGGASGGATSVTPVLAISVSDNETLATIDTGTTLELGKALTAQADNESSVKTVAEGATEAGKTGVGISLALSIGTDLAAATTARSLIAGGAITLGARNVGSNSGKSKASVAGGDDTQPATKAEQDKGGVNSKVDKNRSFAGDRSKAKGGSDAPSTEGASAEGEGGNKVQVAGAVTVSVTSATARAKVGDGLSIEAGKSTSDGILTLKTENNADSEAIADASTVMPGEGKGSGTGIGIAVAVNVATVVNEAILGTGTVQADGVVLQALVPSVGTDKGHAFRAEATSGASGADTGVAGALAINVGISRAQAKIASGGVITVNDAGTVDFTAENFVTNTVKASAKQTGGGKVGVGASIALNIGETDTDALITQDADIKGAGTITLKASSKNAMDTSAEGGSAGKTAVTPVVAISVSDNETLAKVESLSVASLQGTTTLRATWSWMRPTKVRTRRWPRAQRKRAARAWASPWPWASVATSRRPPSHAT